MPTVDDDLPSGLGPEAFSAWIFGAAEPVAATGLELAPFCGVRFAPEVVGDLAAVTSPPYDVIDEEALGRLLASDGHNIVRLILPPTAAEGADTLRRWLTVGALAADPEPALYVYEAASGETPVQRGLIGALGLRAESSGVVLPHENVYPGPVRNRLELMAATHANSEPIFLIYEGGGDAATIIDEIAATTPLVEFQGGDGLTHRLWLTSDPDHHARVAADLGPRQALIADGHHRYATYRALQARHHAAGDGPGPWDHGLALLVDSTRYPPYLGAIHRVLPDLPPAEAVALAARIFQVTEQPDLPTALDALASVRHTEQATAFVVGGGESLYLLTATGLADSMPADHSERWRGLDTAILDRLLIEGVWKIPEDERSVEVVHDDPAAAIERAHRTGGTAVILNPLSVEDVLAVAADGDRVPRKSTSFGPKPRTGLVLRLLTPNHPRGARR
ncbi:DUF1015 domain-containing protein [Spirillospora sp. NPDC047279]|uniref:DUF1015 domain-containing protein n=1 Tax=Spirillospora sp. NPDC047279 TaxID=3155478 RepID=UPI0033D53183